MTRQRIIKAFPPNFRQIAETFPVKGRPGIIYAYGPILYNPTGVGPLPSWILAHEAVHGKRQIAQGVDAWWTEYLIYPSFRLKEEVLAHRAELETFLASEFCHAMPADRMLDTLAQRLSSPLYGGLVTLEKAKRLILSKEDA